MPPNRETKSCAPEPRRTAPLQGHHPLGRVRLRLGAQAVLLLPRLRSDLRAALQPIDDGAGLDLARASHPIRTALPPLVMRPRAASPRCHVVSRWDIRVASTLQPRV